MKTELLQPAATLAAALVATQGKNGRQMEESEITKHFLASYRALEEALKQIPQKPAKTETLRV